MNEISRKGQCTFLTFPEPLPTRIIASDVHPVDLQAKSKLLSPVVPFAESYINHAKEILGHVQALSEGALKDVFKLKSDDISHIPLRILNPGCNHVESQERIASQDQEGMEKFERLPDRLQEVFIAESNSLTEVEESYVTASYCWLQPEEAVAVQDQAAARKSPDSWIDVGVAEPASYPLPVSPLLYHALLQERQSPREGVWIDQVCINQTSSAEKQIAVNAMDLIYKCARTVVVLLDDIKVSLAEQDFLASYIVEFEQYKGDGSFFEPHYNERPPFMKANPVLRDFFLKLVGAKWFERAWCMHEMRLSPQHIFLIRCEDDPQIRNGIKSAPTVLRFTNIFMMHILGLAIPTDLQQSRLRPLLSVFADSLINHLGGHRGIPSYMQVFADTFRQGAGGNPALDPVAREHDANLDKLSIAINTIGIGLAVTRAIPIETRETEIVSLPPATPDECCRRFTTLALAAADPSALCSTGAELQLGGKSRTWMRWPLFTDIGLSRNSMSRLRRFDIDFDASAEAAYVGLDMCFYNGDGRGASAGGIRWASERKLRTCRAFKDGCEFRKITAVYYYKNYGPILTRSQIRKKVIRTLAAIMECGIEWLLFVAEHSVDDWDTKVLVAGVQRLLDHEKLASTKGKEEVFDVKYLDSRNGRTEAELLLDFVRYLMQKALPWSSERSLDAYEAVCIVNTITNSSSSSPEIGNNRALMYAQVPDSGSNVDVVCATPMVLLHDEYSELFRGWTLVKGTPDRVKDDVGNWKWKFHLVEKSVIFGMISGSEDLTREGGVQCRFGQAISGVRMYGPEDS
jgi:Heterokaryon incompatibility protein (HET)